MEGRLLRAAILAILLLTPAGLAEAQVADRLDRIDRIDRINKTAAAERAARLAAAERAAKRVLEARRLQDQPTSQPPSEPQRTPPEQTVATLLSDNRLERTRDGFAARRGEVLALDLSAAARAAALAAGMNVMTETQLSGGSRLARLGAPPQMDAAAALDLLRAADPAGVFDFNHAFTTSGRLTTIEEQAPAPQPPAAKGVAVGMIDGGVMANHRDLSQATIHQRAFPAGSTLAATDHGTAVAGRLAETIGAPFSLAVADVLDETGAAWSSADALAEGLAWLSGDGVAVVNISLAGPPNAVVEAMVKRSLGQGARIVAAVGNGGPFSRMIYPAAYPGVVGVTAVDAAGKVYALASTGKHVDMSAPGVDVRIATLAGHGLASGTSYAAPVVAGRMAAETGAALTASLAD